MTPLDFAPDTPVGRIATEAPLATRVFARHAIDYCCGGGVPIAAACADRGLAVEDVLDEIRLEIQAADAPSEAWASAPLTDLIDHILTRYHAPLEEELPRLAAMAAKVNAVHGPKDPQRLGALAEVVRALQADLEPHLLKEEQILFPLIRRGQGSMAGGPVHVMRLEHEAAGELLQRLRALTDDYTVPEQACNTWRALWHGLARLERDLHEHIHLENNVLFPRALGEPAGRAGA